MRMFTSASSAVSDNQSCSGPHAAVSTGIYIKRRKDTVARSFLSLSFYSAYFLVVIELFQCSCTELIKVSTEFLWYLYSTEQSHRGLSKAETGRRQKPSVVRFGTSQTLVSNTTTVLKKYVGTNLPCSALALILCDTTRPAYNVPLFKLRAPDLPHFFLQIITRVGPRLSVISVTAFSSNRVK